MKTKQQRIDIVNELIREIAYYDRKFFYYEGGTAYVFQRGGKLFMWNEYNGSEMCLSVNFNKHPVPKRWHHGGTLLALTKDFCEYIKTGEKTNGNNGYGGLYCPHWGYSENMMCTI